MNRETLLGRLEPLLQVLSGLDAGVPASAAHRLNAEDWSELAEAAKEALREGWLVTKPAGPHVSFGRLSKPSPETCNFSIDAVVMDGPAPAPHTHLTGEFDFSIPLEGNPRFDGHGEPWFVYPPGSRHLPTVTGGKMLILYFVPEGKVRFE